MCLPGFRSEVYRGQASRPAPPSEVDLLAPGPPSPDAPEPFCAGFSPRSGEGSLSRGSAYATRGTAVLGGTLLAAALARLVLPNRFAGVLASRRKASDVLAFAVFGAAVLAVALSLP